MRVLITGTKTFGDTYLLDLILDGLEDALLDDDKEVVVITGQRKGAEHMCQMIADSRHSKVRIWTFGHEERFPRNKMIKVGKPQMGFMLGDLDFPDDKISMKWLTRLADAGIPTYIISKIDNESVNQWQS